MFIIPVYPVVKFNHFMLTQRNFHISKGGHFGPIDSKNVRPLKAFDFMFRYIHVDLISQSNSKFGDFVDRICSILALKKRKNST